MKKVIILLFLAISFVMMTLISYMKFQTIFYLESNNINDKYDEYKVDHFSPSYPDPEYQQVRGF